MKMSSIYFILSLLDKFIFKNFKKSSFKSNIKGKKRGKIIMGAENFMGIGKIREFGLIKDDNNKLIKDDNNKDNNNNNNKDNNNNKYYITFISNQNQLITIGSENFNIFIQNNSENHSGSGENNCLKLKISEKIYVNLNLSENIRKILECAVCNDKEVKIFVKKEDSKFELIGISIINDSITSF